MDIVDIRFFSLPDLTTRHGEEFEVGSERWGYVASAELEGVLV